MGNESDDLNCLSEAHLIGKDAAHSVGCQSVEPLGALFLIASQRELLLSSRQQFRLLKSLIRSRDLDIVSQKLSKSGSLVEQIVQFCFLLQLQWSMERL